MRRPLLLVGCMVPLWLVAVVMTGIQPMPLLALPLAVVGWLGVVVVAVTLGVVLTRRRWSALLAVGICVGATMVLALLTVNWSTLAPRAYFAMHRPLFDRAAAATRTDESYYGTPLPLTLRSLSVNHSVRNEDGVLFFPQWMGMPDDAGGYFWSPHRSPAGADMFGMLCTEPDDLGGGWWACGM